MAKRVSRGAAESAPPPLAIDAPVVVFPGTDQQQGGVIVEDFGERSFNAVILPGWAVKLNDGTLVFVDSEQLSAL